jgi:Mrp family chromosome partitioning ATPase/capsular polysaccharide biosynthesis protein
LTFRQLLSIIGNRWIVVVVCIVAALAGSAIYVEQRIGTYQAVATVQLAIPLTASGQPLLNVPDPDNAVNDAAVAARAASAIGTTNQGTLAGHVTGTFDTTTKLLSITASEPRPKLAQALADAFARAYVSTVQATAASQVARLNSALASLHRKITALEQSVTSPGAAADAVATAEVSSLSQAYETLTLQAESLQVSGPYATLQTSASFPSQPSGSSHKTIGGLALLVGLLAGVGLALVSEQLDTRIRSDVDLDRLTDIPILAELPLQRRGASAGTSLAFVDQPRSAISESFRELRTSIRATTGDRGSVCILVTSPAPADGKTFVTANLAAAEASTGRQVAVVSANLQDRKIEAVLGCSEAAALGLAYLSSLPHGGRAERDGGLEERSGSDGSPQAEPPAETLARTLVTGDRDSAATDGEIGASGSQRDLSANLVPTAVPGVSLLPVGANGSNVSDLFADNGLHGLVKELKSTFDLVLFDTSAVMSAPDAAILSRVVDGVIVVVSVGQTSRRVVERALQRLQSIRAPLLGIAMNRVTRSTSATYHPLRRGPKQLAREERQRPQRSHARERSQA